MTPPGTLLRDFAADLKIGILFSTRAPLIHGAPIGGADIARASWALPIAGALVGLLGALVYWLAHKMGLPPFAAATLTVGATLLATGCLHEDGLADSADGFGGGATRARKLEIMRDSRIGSYGACALGISLLLRVGALASIADPVLAASALIAAHAGARATLPLFMLAVPQARDDGLAADAGRPAATRAAGAGMFGLIALGLGLSPLAALTAVLLLSAAIAVLAWLCTRQIGGQTGDVLGALEQAGEILILLTAAAAA
jgi:adenosylcobinamide-GDP ribazoletransferase